jgi:dGTPase
LVAVDQSLDLSTLYNDEWWLERPRRENKKAAGDVRTQLERDRDRITHSSALRRLSTKTQVIGSPWADGFRNRLTHTLEVSQIGRSIARRHRLSEALVEASCLGHDLGHPPFGHAGERCLNEMMKEHGGFDANAQTLRVLHSLEVKSSGTVAGLNLTRATFWSVLKYPYRHSGAQVGGAVGKDRLDEKGLRRSDDGSITALSRYLYDEDLALRTEAGESFESWLGGDRVAFPHDPGRRLQLDAPRTAACEVMNWADDVAYAIHDFEDAVVAGFITAGSIARIRDELLVAVERDIGADGDRSTFGVQAAAGCDGDLVGVI